MKNFCRFLLVSALLSSVTVEASAQSKAKTSASKKAVKTKNRRPKLIAHWEGVMGRKMSEAQKVQLRRAADDRERANKKFRSDIAKLFGTSTTAMAARERAYNKAHPAKRKP